MLSLLNNLSSQIAQTNLSNANNALTTSLQRLSSGLRINSGADDPAGLVISQEQMAQMSGLQTAITNTSKATNVVQIADGALNETNALLLQIRGLAVDAANSGVNDTNSLAADQAQIANALSTISRIAVSTQFGSKQLLDGSHAAGISTNVSSITAAAGATLAQGSYSVNITTAATAANMTATNAVTTNGAAEQLTINGVQISIAANSSENAMIGDINAVSNQTGVVAMDSNSNGSGKLTLYATTFGSGHKITVSSPNTDVTGLVGATSNDGVDMQATITTTPPSNSGQAAVTQTLTGIGNTLTVNSGAAAGLTVTDGATNTVYSSATSNPYTAANGVINVETNNALTFQIGANAGQFANLTIESVQAAALGQNASANIANLSLIDVTNANQSSSDILKVIDKAINDVSTLAGALGAFQDNTLQATAANLQASLQNTTAANSTIRDTNFAQESANYAQNQVLVQAGTQVLKNANQLPQLALTLLQ